MKLRIKNKKFLFSILIIFFLFVSPKIANSFADGEISEYTDSRGNAYTKADLRKFQATSYASNCGSYDAGGYWNGYRLEDCDDSTGRANECSLDNIDGVKCNKESTCYTEGCYDNSFVLQRIVGGSTNECGPNNDESCPSYTINYPLYILPACIKHEGHYDDAGLLFAFDCRDCSCGPTYYSYDKSLLSCGGYYYLGDPYIVSSNILGNPVCEATHCYDGFDNDYDGLVDSNDPDCKGYKDEYCSETSNCKKVVGTDPCALIVCSRLKEDLCQNTDCCTWDDDTDTCEKISCSSVTCSGLDESSCDSNPCCSWIKLQDSDKDGYVGDDDCDCISTCEDVGVNDDNGFNPDHFCQISYFDQPSIASSINCADYCKHEYILSGHIIQPGYVDPDTGEENTVWGYCNENHQFIPSEKEFWTERGLINTAWEEYDWEQCYNDNACRGALICDFDFDCKKVSVDGELHNSICVKDSTLGYGVCTKPLLYKGDANFNADIKDTVQGFIWDPSNELTYNNFAGAGTQNPTLSVTDLWRTGINTFYDENNNQIQTAYSISFYTPFLANYIHPDEKSSEAYYLQFTPITYKYYETDVVLKGIDYNYPPDAPEEVIALTNNDKLSVMSSEPFDKVCSATIGLKEIDSNKIIPFCYSNRGSLTDDFSSISCENALNLFQDNNERPLVKDYFIAPLSNYCENDNDELVNLNPRAKGCFMSTSINNVNYLLQRPQQAIPSDVNNNKLTDFCVYNLGCDYLASWTNDFTSYITIKEQLSSQPADGFVSGPTTKTTTLCKCYGDLCSEKKECKDYDYSYPQKIMFKNVECGNNGLTGDLIKAGITDTLLFDEKGNYCGITNCASEQTTVEKESQDYYIFDSHYLTLLNYHDPFENPSLTNGNFDLNTEYDASMTCLGPYDPENPTDYDDNLNKCLQQIKSSTGIFLRNNFFPKMKGSSDEINAKLNFDVYNCPFGTAVFNAHSDHIGMFSGNNPWNDYLVNGDSNTKIRKVCVVPEGYDNDNDLLLLDDSGNLDVQKLLKNSFEGWIMLKLENTNGQISEISFDATVPEQDCINPWIVVFVSDGTTNGNDYSTLKWKAIDENPIFLGGITSHPWCRDTYSNIYFSFDYIRNIVLDSDKYPEIKNAKFLLIGMQTYAFHISDTSDELFPKSWINKNYNYESDVYHPLADQYRCRSPSKDTACAFERKSSIFEITDPRAGFDTQVKISNLKYNVKTEINDVSSRTCDTTSTDGTFNDAESDCPRIKEKDNRKIVFKIKNEGTGVIEQPGFILIPKSVQQVCGRAETTDNCLIQQNKNDCEQYKNCAWVPVTSGTEHLSEGLYVCKQLTDCTTIDCDSRTLDSCDSPCCSIQGESSGFYTTTASNTPVFSIIDGNIEFSQDASAWINFAKLNCNGDKCSFVSKQYASWWIPELDEKSDYASRNHCQRVDHFDKDGNVVDFNNQLNPGDTITIACDIPYDIYSNEFYAFFFDDAAPIYPDDSKVILEKTLDTDKVLTLNLRNALAIQKPLKEENEEIKFVINKKEFVQNDFSYDYIGSLLYAGLEPGRTNCVTQPLSVKDVKEIEMSFVSSSDYSEVSDIPEDIQNKFLNELNIDTPPLTSEFTPIMIVYTTDGKQILADIAGNEHKFVANFGYDDEGKPIIKDVDKIKVCLPTTDENGNEFINDYPWIYATSQVSITFSDNTKTEFNEFYGNAWVRMDASLNDKFLDTSGNSLSIEERTGSTDDELFGAYCSFSSDSDDVFAGIPLNSFKHFWLPNTELSKNGITTKKWVGMVYLNEPINSNEGGNPDYLELIIPGSPSTFITDLKLIKVDEQTNTNKLVLNSKWDNIENNNRLYYSESVIRGRSLNNKDNPSTYGRIGTEKIMGRFYEINPTISPLYVSTPSFESTSGVSIRIDGLGAAIDNDIIYNYNVFNKGWYGVEFTEVCDSDSCTWMNSPYFVMKDETGVVKKSFEEEAITEKITSSSNNVQEFSQNLYFPDITEGYQIGCALYDYKNTPAFLELNFKAILYKLKYLVDYDMLVEEYSKLALPVKLFQNPVMEDFITHAIDSKGNKINGLTAKQEVSRSEGKITSVTGKLILEQDVSGKSACAVKLVMKSADKFIMSYSLDAGVSGDVIVVDSEDNLISLSLDGSSELTEEFNPTIFVKELKICLEGGKDKGITINEIKFEKQSELDPQSYYAVWDFKPKQVYENDGYANIFSLKSVNYLFGPNCPNNYCEPFLGENYENCPDCYNVCDGKGDNVQKPTYDCPANSYSFETPGCLILKNIGERCDYNCQCKQNIDEEILKNVVCNSQKVCAPKDYSTDATIMITKLQKIGECTAYSHDYDIICKNFGKVELNNNQIIVKCYDPSTKIITEVCRSSQEPPEDIYIPTTEKSTTQSIYK